MTGHTHLYCVDLFPRRSDWYKNADGSYSFKVRINGETYGGYEDQTVWQEPFLRDIAPLYEKHESVFDIFQDSIDRCGVGDLITAHHGTSTTFMSSISPSVKCRMAFLDGDHSYTAVCQDIRNIQSLLVPGGWICFDDAFSHYDGVNRAITELILASDEYDLKQQMTRKCFAARKALSARPLP
jgi:hypothetical protein